MSLFSPFRSLFDPLNPFARTQSCRIPGPLGPVPIPYPNMGAPGTTGIIGDEAPVTTTSPASDLGDEAGQLQGPITRAQALKRYGFISNGVWKDESKWMVVVPIPANIQNDPNYRWVIGGTKTKVTRIYMNIDIKPKILDALANTQQANLLFMLKTWDGTFNIRNTRGSSAVSGHSYGIAIDINAGNNPLGETPNMNQKLVNAWTRAGLTWGGNFSRPDGMHFSLGF